jgi:coenzyme F420-0:L-glutamate ligase/coenzyme F420-1:gamma-L-glutamate ligase
VTAPSLQIFGLDGIDEVREGDDLVQLILDALQTSSLSLENGDVLVVTHKIVSKAEGRLVDLRAIEPSALATQWAEAWGKDSRQVEVVLREAKRIVRMERGILIAETEHGFVCANAGVDASNVRPETVCLLPRDPDGSAAAIREGLRTATGADVGVIISDSFGRPWRNGIVNVAIGVAGIPALADYRGQTDAAGYDLHVTVIAIADELASAAELITNKLDDRPVALIRGYQFPVDRGQGSEDRGQGTGKDLIMDSSRDLFR